MKWFPALPLGSFGSGGHSVGGLMGLVSVTLATSWSKRVISITWLLGNPCGVRTAIWCGSNLPKPLEASTITKEDPELPELPAAPPPPHAVTPSSASPRPRRFRERKEVGCTRMFALLAEEVREHGDVRSRDGIDAGLEHARVDALQRARGELQHVDDAGVGHRQEQERG